MSQEILRELNRLNKVLADYRAKHPNARIPKHLEDRANRLYDKLERERQQAKRG